ncbi:type II toxin-antitoxin system RelE/ParE family toxin [bacterium]|nr:type II toxin-antitoxin system RelE/ParE family toxin [bacterium]
MYNIIITERALRDINKLDSGLKNRIGKKLKQFTKNPLKYARKLKRPEIGSFRFRIGDYRVVFDIDENTIVILRVGHRKDIYK